MMVSKGLCLNASRLTPCLTDTKTLRLTVDPQQCHWLTGWWGWSVMNHTTSHPELDAIYLTVLWLKPTNTS